MDTLDIFEYTCYYRKMGTIFDQEKAGNLFPDAQTDNVVWISEYGSEGTDGYNLEDELMVFPRTLGIDLDEAERKRAALMMVGAATVCGSFAVATAIANGPLPF